HAMLLRVMGGPSLRGPPGSSDDLWWASKTRPTLRTTNYCSWEWSSRRAKSLRGSGAGTLGFELAIARLGACHERIQPRPRHDRHCFDRAVECRLVGLGRLVEPRELADELKRGGPDLVVGGRRVEVEEDLDVSAHCVCL